uniref:Uncharacterized protein n=1 Tax=Glossina austeni TaxID=7395 RepID=A0A1A9VDN9_GLOAU
MNFNENFCSMLQLRSTLHQSVVKRKDLLCLREVLPFLLHLRSSSLPEISNREHLLSVQSAIVPLFISKLLMNCGFVVSPCPPSILVGWYGIAKGSRYSSPFNPQQNQISTAEEDQLDTSRDPLVSVTLKLCLNITYDSYAVIANKSNAMLMSIVDLPPPPDIPFSPATAAIVKAIRAAIKALPAISATPPIAIAIRLPMDRKREEGLSGSSVLCIRCKSVPFIIIAAAIIAS